MCFFGSSHGSTPITIFIFMKHEVFQGLIEEIFSLLQPSSLKREHWYHFKPQITKPLIFWSLKLSCFHSVGSSRYPQVGWTVSSHLFFLFVFLFTETVCHVWNWTAVNMISLEFSWAVSLSDLFKISERRYFIYFIYCLSIG